MLIEFNCLIIVLYGTTKPSHINFLPLLLLQGLLRPLMANVHLLSTSVLERGRLHQPFLTKDILLP